MKFFTEFNVPAGSKIGITSLLSNITQKPGSHKGGWSRLLKCQLNSLGQNYSVKILDNKDHLDDFNVIIFDMGAEFGGTLNLFGGLDEKCWIRTMELFNFKGMMYSWQHELPNLCSTIQSRVGNVSTYSKFKDLTWEDFIMLGQRLFSTQVFHHVYKTDKMLIGDSHTPSVWTPGFMIERRDGRTLKGMLEKNTIEKYLLRFAQDGVMIKSIHVHAGAIDIRHHVCRTEDPEQEVASMVMNMVGAIHDYEEKAGYEFDNVILTHTVGIEDESRELPQTGYFKKTPFFGSAEKRMSVRKAFNEVVDDYTKDCPGWTHIEIPAHFFDEAGKMKFEYMEKPGSVHTSPEHYRWDLDKNVLRWEK